MPQERKRCPSDGCGFIAKPRSVQDICPRCGTELVTDTYLDFEVELDVSIPFAMTVQSGDGPSRKSPRLIQIKNELHRDSGRSQQAHRTFDRHDDRYRETITDLNTGEVMVSKDEPLSGHTERGSARGKRVNPPD